MRFFRNKRVVRWLLLCGAPVAGVAAGALTNIITQRWSWWTFVALAVVTAFVTAGAVAAAPPGASDGGGGTGPVGATSVLTPPAGTRVFTGRQRELEQLMADPQKPDRIDPVVKVVTGLPGSGKTELVIRACQQLRDRYPDGVFWLRMRTYARAESRLSAGEALRYLLSASGAAQVLYSTDLSRLTAAWRAASASRRLLVVLDDVKDAAQVRALLPVGNRSAVLVTSRNVLVGLDPDLTLQLGLLEEEEARLLAAEILRRAGRPEDALGSLIASKFRLPLAIRQVADFASANPGAGLDVVAGDEVATSFALSVARLPGEARLVLRRVARYPGSSITPAVAAALAGLPEKKAREMLMVLYRRGLLEVETAGAAFRLHDLIREVASSGGAGRDLPFEARRADRRLFAYVEESVASASRMMWPGDDATDHARRPYRGGIALPVFHDDIDALGWLDTNYSDLKATLRMMIAAESRHAWRIACNLEFYQRMRGFFADAVELLTACLTVVEKQGDVFGQAVVQQGLGLAQRFVNNYDAARAHTTEALRLHSQVGYAAGQAEAHHELGKLAVVAGDEHGARLHAEAAGRFAIAADDAAAMAVSHLDFGIVEWMCGRLELAREHLLKAEEQLQHVGVRHLIALSRHYLGRVTLEAGETGEARSLLTSALEMVEASADIRLVPTMLVSLGDLEIQLGNWDAAGSVLDRALRLSAEAGLRVDEARACLALARLPEAADGRPVALRHLQSALSIYQALGFDLLVAKVQAQLDEMSGGR
ncbi:hypothetical protein CS0771_45300 [Catellatospora sp. IY07-71]|uniref:tetratricopeptide repeat protein n=1 Tax=Catellatospora sp. IY07-71 TaxID=2728827 RepID=UPI001BB3CAFC|nr:tetratricopeptide repeat protein [Catellatospora sp. IY07-71]BCJ74986.1 hypothetical protein CS0771_45300 [Catellatospora sp. IY07-71]